MILYNVTVNIESGVEADWLTWMKDIHIPEVMETGMFVEHKIFKLLQDEPQGSTYSVQYFAKSMREIEEYQAKYASKLQQDHTNKFMNKFVAFRTLLEKVN